MTWLPCGPEDQEWPTCGLSVGGQALRRGARSALAYFPPSEQDPLAALSALRWMQASQRCEQLMLIAQARSQGRSWSEIAGPMGMSKQSAHVQFRALADEFRAIAELEQESPYSDGGDFDEQVRDFVDHHFPEVWTPLD